MFPLLSIFDTFVLSIIPLYFPEDKSEYIPAFIQLALVVVAAVLVVVFLKKLSKKQEKEAKELEERLNQEEKNKHL
ncbi:hypothetical protein [Bacillus niameyensis]|uniref:hypothetical protein n=1 Tax=Bacillus niameyensis TaxID=1522308 RepID=UPI00078453F4|nr:hypothetical protein [Bacillus niameyensis]